MVKKDPDKLLEQKNKLINSAPNNNLWIPKHNIKMKYINNNTWFDFQQSDHRTLLKKFNPKEIQFNEFNDETLYYAKQVDLDLTKEQKKILQKHFISGIKMYNEALKYIKTNKIYKFEKVRDALKPICHEIVERSGDVKEKRRHRKNKKGEKRQINCKKPKHYVKVHDLDLMVDLACCNYKSALSNFRAGNIKHFKVKKWKFNKKIKILHLEKTGFTGEDEKKKRINTMLRKALGKVKATFNGKEFDFGTVKCDSKIQYNDFTKKYTLFVSEVVDKIDTNPVNKIISLDPGVRTFMTGITEKNVIKIGSNCGDKIRYYLRKIDNINNSKMHLEQKRKLERKYNSIINNFVDEMHWKTINELTKNYKVILLGDMSCQDITNKRRSKLDNMTKRVTYKLKFYQFKQRLENKCKIRSNYFKYVDESYTSKICSSCGNVKDNLGGNKVYDCSNCHKVICRDTNGARNIYAKAFV